MSRTLSRLKAMIVSGELSPGEQIRQEEMADQLHVSRVPLREAMNVLADQGLLVHRPHQGYFVSKRTADEHAQIRRMVHLLENELMASMRWPDALELGQLSALNQQMAGCVRGADIRGLIELNREFHFRIFSLSPQKLVLEEVGRLWAMSEPSMWIKFERADDRERTLLEHDRLLDALAERDRPRCVMELDRHRHNVGAGLQAGAHRPATQASLPQMSPLP